MSPRVPLLLLVVAALASGCTAPSTSGGAGSDVTAEGPDVLQQHLKGRLAVAAQFSASTQTHSFLMEGEDRLPLPPNVLNMTFTLAWTPTSPAFETVDLGLGQDGTFVARKTGKSPLVVEVMKGDLSSGEVKILVQPPPPAGAAVRQEFSWTAHVTHESFDGSG